MDESDQKRDRVLKAALDYRVELLAYARSLLGNYAAAEDAVQDALISALVASRRGLVEGMRTPGGVAASPVPGSAGAAGRPSAKRPSVAQ